MEEKVVHNEQGVAEQRSLVKPYPNPPLMEALCEFRFAGGSPWDGTVPGLVYEQLRDQFPKRKQVRAIEVQITSSEKGTDQVVRPSERVHLLQEDERAVVQVGANVLVVNCLRPYPSWRRFSQLIGRAFNAYREAAQPGELATIGLRYMRQTWRDTSSFGLSSDRGFPSPSIRSSSVSLSRTQTAVIGFGPNSLVSVRLGRVLSCSASISTTSLRGEGRCHSMTR